MPLTVSDFEGFDPEDARRFLRSFDSRTAKKGESYYRAGAVLSVKCTHPGRIYLATVRGSLRYEVKFQYERGWTAACSCPMMYDCKHVYAALKQLLTEHIALAAAPASPLGNSLAQELLPSEFAGAAQEKLGRNLKKDEIAYLRNINQLFRKAAGSGLRYRNELTGLGLPTSTVGYWDVLELYPKPPQTEAEFWNFLALYLTEKAGHGFPDFMQLVTDFDKARAAMRKHFRARDIERWKQTLNYLDDRSGYSQPEQAVAELRARFLREKVSIEWRPTGSDQWQELKPRKIDDFDARYASSLSAEAALLWLPFWHRAKTQYNAHFEYHDPWIVEQAGRWLRQPSLRPLLANEAGEPLVFHDAPLHWQVDQPEDDDGDYSFSLVQADGQPAPKLLLTAQGFPTAIYLSVIGVFHGPPFAESVMSKGLSTSIPAKALESAAGLRLLDRLQTAPPPRLAAKVRKVKLQPWVRAEVKTPLSSTSEYCYVDVFGASEDGKHVEYLGLNGWIPKDSKSRAGKSEFIQIDRTALGALIPPLDQAGFKWEYLYNRWQLRVTKKFAGTFIDFLKSLPAGTRIELDADLASLQNADVAGKIRLEASELEMDWFDLRVVVDVSDTTLTREEIKLLLDAKGNWVRLTGKGWRKLQFDLTEEEDRELARLGLTPHQLTSESQRLHAFQLADKAARKFLPEETCGRIERRAAELQARVTPDVPADIRAELRPYQRDGFHFLAYLSTNRFGGILADDMGLGKTVQTLTWLAWLRGAASEKSRTGKTPSLVVCPKSVADNWQAEAAKFFPDLKVRVWAASDLKTFAETLPSADLHVLNYSQLRLVGDGLAAARFHVVILDEGQYIKNPASQTAQIARQLRAEHRLVLSGTPIENRLLDLWSLMSFAMPGALGSRAEFGRLYDAKNDPFARQRLSARVRPFLIRRTKAQVARDLPDRIEEDLFCELEDEQKTLYRAELKRAQAMLLKVKTVAALNKQRFNFLTSLLRLRQICCHPKLVKPDSSSASAKVEALVETLEPVIEEGEKVLVFSQFVELLDILREDLTQRGWRHWYLAGDTENRGDLVREFQAAEGAGVFLISLKAGGFGLNLTAAGYVVLFDPWWNPAVENQAIDRTHRIGQNRKVIAYRLLIKDSIEEKIRALQRQKKSLAENVLGEEKFAQGLSLDDLRYLLED